MTIPGSAIAFDSFGRTSTAGWGTADSGQAWDSLGVGSVVTTDWTIDGSGAHHKVQVASAFRFTRLAAVSLQDVDISATGSLAITAHPTGGQVEILGVMWRVIDTANYYLARVDVQTDGTMNLTVLGNGGNTLIAQNVGIFSAATYTSGEVLSIRARMFNSRIQVKIWVTSSGEPTAWNLSLFDNQYQTAGAVALRTGVGGGNTNTKPVVTSYTEFWAAPAPVPIVGNFLTNVFGPRSIAYLEIAPGADLTQLPSTWTFTDITADLREDAGFKTTKGRPDQARQAQPSTGKTTLRNGPGNYTTRRARSIYYPYMRRDLPMRFGLDIPGYGYSERWSGFADSILPTWDLSGKMADCAMSGSGILRRLGQGDQPIRSALTRSILGNQSLGLVRYWPCEDANGADSAASALSKQAPMQVAGTVAFGTVDFSQGTGPISALPGIAFGMDLMPQFLSGGSLSATFTAGSATSWTVQASVYVDPAINDAPLVLFQWSEGGRIWQVVSDGLTIDSVHLAVNGVTICTEPHIMISEDVRIDVAQSGGNISVSFKPMLAHAAQTATISTATLGGITGYTINPNNTVVTGMFSVGEVRIWDGNAAPDFKTAINVNSAWDAYKGEMADARMARLCAEENIPFVPTGTSEIAMGKQPIDTLLNILRMCEQTDQGVLSDGINFGLAYTCFNARISPPVTLALAASDLSAPLAPVDDDQTPANDVTYQQGLTQSGTASGTSARAVDEDSIAAHGQTQNTVTVNTLDSSPLLSMASWDIHLANVDVERYPDLQLNWAARPVKALDWLDAVEGSRVTVDDLPDQASDGDVDTLIEGWAEAISVMDWTADLNTSPAQPWRVAVVDDAEFGIVAVSDATVNTDSGSTISVNVPTSPWTLKPGAYPQDINVNGERCTITAAPSSLVSPQTLPVIRSVNDVVKTHSAGDPVDIWAPNYVGR